MGRRIAIYIGSVLALVGGYVLFEDKLTKFHRDYTMEPVAMNIYAPWTGGCHPDHFGRYATFEIYHGSMSGGCRSLSITDFPHAIIPHLKKHLKIDPPVMGEVGPSGNGAGFIPSRQGGGWTQGTRYVVRMDEPVFFRAPYSNLKSKVEPFQWEFTLPLAHFSIDAGEILDVDFASETFTQKFEVKSNFRTSKTSDSSHLNLLGPSQAKIISFVAGWELTISGLRPAGGYHLAIASSSIFDGEVEFDKKPVALPVADAATYEARKNELIKIAHNKLRINYWTGDRRARASQGAVDEFKILKKSMERRGQQLKLKCNESEKIPVMQVMNQAESAFAPGNQEFEFVILDVDAETHLPRSIVLRNRQSRVLSCERTP